MKKYTDIRAEETAKETEMFLSDLGNGISLSDLVGEKLKEFAVSSKDPRGVEMKKKASLKLPKQFQWPYKREKEYYEKDFFCKKRLGHRQQQQWRKKQEKALEKAKQKREEEERQGEQKKVDTYQKQLFKAIFDNYTFIDNPSLSPCQLAIKNILSSPIDLIESRSTNSSFHNLCLDSTQLPNLQPLLGLGLNFCLTPTSMSKLPEIKTDKFQKDYF